MTLARPARRAKTAPTAPSTRGRPAAAQRPILGAEALTTPAAFDLPAEEILQRVTDPDGIRIGNEAAAEIRRRLEIEFDDRLRGA